MAYHIKDPATDRKLRELARVKGKTMAASLREAIDRDLARESEKLSDAELLAPVFAAIDSKRTIWDPVDWAAVKRDDDERWGR